MWNSRRATCVAAALSLVGAASAVHAAQRVALVIGNADYRHVPTLANPRNDAADVAVALERLGFEVDILAEAGRARMFDGLKQFARAARSADIAVVFYAGHGIEVDRANYLVPVDAELKADTDVEYEAVPLGLVTGSVAVARSFGLVILDACRDNPFRRRMEVAGATRSIGRGLGRVEPPASSVAVAYAARDGTTAADGEGRNSPYTRALLQHIGEPELVGEMLNKVAESVLRQTGGGQEPVVYGRLPSGAYFTGTGRRLAGNPASGAGPDPAAEAWKVVRDVRDPALVEAFLADWPGSVYASAARALLAKLPRAGHVFRDCGDCPEMVVIPGGRFRMGCLSAGGCSGNTKPVREVRIGKQFALGRYEVTFREWDACVAGGGCGGYRPRDDWGRGNRPVTKVSWQDARSYARWLSRQTRQMYRLPSEAEWEYSARAGTTAPHHFGSAEKDLCRWGNGKDLDWKEGDQERDDSDVYACRDGYEYAAPVGMFGANPFGLHDVHGNMEEWVQDCVNDSYTNAPTDGSAWLAGDCTRHVVRGGSWVSGPRYYHRASSRSSYPTANRNTTVGFRVARTLAP